MRINCMLFLAATACLAIACEKEKQLAEESGTETSFNDLAFFQKATDGYGVALDPDYPDHLYIGVGDYDEAETLFLSWVAPGGDVRWTPPSTDLVYQFTDEDGNRQGCVTFAENYEDGHVADLYVEKGTELPFRRISFLLHDAWPPFHGEASKWQLGDIATKIRGYTSVCIREAGQGVKGLLLALTSEEYWGNGYIFADGGRNMTNNGMNLDWVNRYVPDETEAVSIAKILCGDWDFYVDCFKEAKAGALVRGREYWTSFHENKIVYERRWTMVLSTPNNSGLEWWNIELYMNPTRHVILRETF